jgi:hypothetical protein
VAWAYKTRLGRSQESVYIDQESAVILYILPSTEEEKPEASTLWGAIVRDNSSPGKK